LRILVIDEDQHLSWAQGLREHGHCVEVADSGQAALDRHADADAVIINTMLPDISGFEVCRMIRAVSGVPIVVLNEKNDEIDCVLALKLGADDCVAKPYGLRELAARIEAIVRRAATAHGHRNNVIARDCESRTRNAGPVLVNLSTRGVTVDARKVNLTRKEFDLLALLVEDPGRVLTKERIMKAVWGHDGAGDTRTLGVHIASLRRKLGVPELIETVWGVGFRITDEH